MKSAKSFVLACLILSSGNLGRTQGVNNLNFPEGTLLNTDGSFGKVEKSGKGKIFMILLADAGFDWSIYEDFMNRNRNNYTFYAVTLPGSGGTPPLPMPQSKTSYAKRTGLEALENALIDLINKEKLEKPVICGNLIIATWLSLNTAIDYPDKVSSVIVFSGMPYATWPSYRDTSGKTPVGMDERGASVDFYYVPRVFKTMTRDAWIKNLFQPYQYSNDSVLAQNLFAESASVMIPTMVRFLAEFYTTDVSLEFDKIRKPVLVLEPGFDDQYFSDHPHSTDKKYFWNEWDKASGNSNFQIEKVRSARLFVWKDQPGFVDQRIKKFLQDN